MVKESVK